MKNPKRIKTRNKRIWKLYHEDGFLLREIASIVNLSAERVSQILERPMKN